MNTRGWIARLGVLALASVACCGGRRPVTSDGGPLSPPSAQLSCGDPEVMARFAQCHEAETRTTCVDAGGTWSAKLGCVCPTGQAGCPCTSSAQCLTGGCLAPSEPPFSDCDSTHSGTCSAVAPLQGGCYCVLGFDGGPAGSYCAE